MGCGNNVGDQQAGQGNPALSFQSMPQAAPSGPPMSLVGGGTNAIPTSYGAQAAAMPSSAQISAPQLGADPATMQMAANMNYLRQSGAFSTPQQQFASQHPFISSLAAAGQTFGQGLTKQPFATSAQENQTALQNTQMQGLNATQTPQNMINMAMLAQMRASLNPQSPVTGPGQMSGKQGATLTPDQLQAIRANAPKGATHFSPSVGYTDAQGNPVK